ncbi:probable RNA-directed DNA polymerase from transposon X-element [Trichonephila clavipes]|nr:probable RNA-directed DNA polymerase from transposon X-element [Trichonephila clavipes]
MIFTTCISGVITRKKQRSAFDQVSEFDRGRIVAYQYCGLPFREIGSRVGQNQTTVMRICDRWMQEGTTNKRGQSHPPQCTTSLEWSVRKTSIAWSTLDAEPQTSPPPMRWSDSSLETPWREDVEQLRYAPPYWSCTGYYGIGWYWISLSHSSSTLCRHFKQPALHLRGVEPFVLPYLQGLPLRGLTFFRFSVNRNSSHKSLNSCRGVISEPDLLTSSETEILEGLSDQGVTQVRRISVKKDSSLFPTKNLILTFNSPKLPSNIKAGYLNCKVRPYIPNPLRCFKCQRFGHSQTSCRGQLACSRCASVGHSSTDCSLEPKCFNCLQPHPSDSKICPKWKIEKQIQEIKTTKNISYPEARKLIVPQLSQTYAQAAKSSTLNNSTQTDENITKINCPPLKLLAPLSSKQRTNIPTAITTSSSAQTQLLPSISSKKIYYIESSATNSHKKPAKNTSVKIAREQDSPNASTPVSKRSRRRKTSKTLDAMDTDVDPSDTDYVTDDVKDIIRQYHPVCVALQETFLKSCHTTKIRRYGCVRKDTEGPSVSGGVCIFTSLDVPSSALPLHTSLQAVAVIIHSTSLITVCCLYLPPNTVIHQHDLNNLVYQLPAPFVILGDFNGHSTLWGSAKTSSRGRQIEQVLSDHCLCLLNHEEPTYFHEPARSFHTLDLAICSPSLYPHLNLSVEKDLYNSDPLPIILSHDYDTGGKTFPPTYSYRRADWALFTQLAVITDAMIKTESVDTAVQEVTNVLITAAELSIPKCSSHFFQHYKPWWNADCQTAYKNQRKLWGIFRRYPTTENLLAFKKAKANARRVRRQSQRQSWIRYVFSLTSSTSSKQLWKKVKAANGIYREFSFLILQTSNSVFSSPVEIANILGETFQSVSSAASYNSRFLVIKRQAERTPINFSTRSFFPYNCDFTMTELKKALLQAHNTSPGPDGITYTMLRHLNPNSLANILFLFNRVWKENCFPSSWRAAIVIPILKPGKVATDPLSYRPIALMSCFLYVLEKEKCISPLQSGFRKGRSTLDNLVFSESQIRDAFVKRNHLVSLFFDIEKAYDRTWRYGILRNIYDFGLRGNLPIFIFNFLAVRYFNVRIGHSSSHKFMQDQGVPQGSVMSVTLFNIHMSNILHQLPSSVRGMLYVGDLQVCCQGSDMRLIERQLQTTVNRLVKWCDQNGHTISPSKSSCIHFCRKRNLHPDPSIHIGNIQIPVVSEVRFLGVIFDSKLTFLPHVLYLRKKCERSLNILKVLLNTLWGADRVSLLRVYQALILSRLDYGCVVYGSARASVLKRLDTVHHSSLRICNGAFRTLPVTSLYVVCHQPLLKLRRRQLSENYFIRAMSVPSHPLKPFSPAIGLT